jgi:Ca-activated chloride channel family protein
VLDKDFVLYYGVSKKEFGVNLLAHAPEGKDGYFMLMLAPSVKPPKGQVVRRDISFVFDASGSMAGDKIKQAREALKYCLNRLNEGDRFNVIRFSTDVEPFGDALLEATAENRKKALAFVDGFQALGGTNIDGALAVALTARRDAKRPHVVIFLTDGKPTIGTADTEVILKNVKAKGGANARIFVFGVGESVNTHLLDRIAGERGGVSQYVKPEEDIEVKVSSFYNKSASPVLSRPAVTVDGLKIRDVHPKTLPDLFAGEQVTLFGRYRGKGDRAIRLTGEVNGEKREFVYEATFAASGADNGFLPHLWATRRVGYLLDQIRLHGESKELKDEVLHLSKTHGIMTPYTSYLVLESDDAYKRHGIPRDRGQKKPVSTAARPARVFAPRPEAVAEEDTGGAAGEELAAVPIFEGKDDVADAPTPLSTAGVGRSGSRIVKGKARHHFAKKEGRRAIRTSEAIREYRRAEVDTDLGPAVKRVGKKLFYFVDGVWTDRAYRKGMKLRKVAYLGDAYFRLLEERPDLKPCLALGEKVIVCLDDKTAVSVQ